MLDDQLESIAILILYMSLMHDPPLLPQFDWMNNCSLFPSGHEDIPFRFSLH